MQALRHQVRGREHLVAGDAVCAALIGQLTDERRDLAGAFVFTCMTDQELEEMWNAPETEEERRALDAAARPPEEVLRRARASLAQQQGPFAVEDEGMQPKQPSYALDKERLIRAKQAENPALTRAHLEASLDQVDQLGSVLLTDEEVLAGKPPKLPVKLLPEDEAKVKR